MRLKQIILNSIELKQLLLNNNTLLSKIETVASQCTNTVQSNGKLLFCGNGGSAADAQHLAAELSAKYYLDRPPIDAEALHVNTSYLTAISNDSSFEHAYARLVEAKAKKGDVLFAISTSGNSKNIIEACKMAKAKGLLIIGLTGESGGLMKDYCDHLINVPSTDTPRIQEVHIMIGHAICEIIESNLFGDD
jgi:D-sedoheptulose 7-phosphate isomerase